MLLLVTLAASVGQPTCVDENTTFTDAFNFTCHDWDGEQCFQKEKDWYDYTYEDLKEVRENCPICCRLPGEMCMNESKHFYDARGFMCQTWHNYSCYDKTAGYGYNDTELEVVRENCPNCCGLISDSTEDEDNAMNVVIIASTAVIAVIALIAAIYLMMREDAKREEQDKLILESKKGGQIASVLRLHIP